MKREDILRYSVKTSGNCVYLRIFRQLSRTVDYIPEHGLPVYSSGGAGLTATAVFVRGHAPERDHKTAMLCFPHITMARTYRARVKTALEGYIDSILASCQAPPPHHIITPCCNNCIHAAVCRMHDALLASDCCDLWRNA